MSTGYSGEFQGGQSGLLETIPKWGPEFYISLDILFHSFDKAQWCSVIHFTASGEDKVGGRMGDRIPGSWTHNAGRLHVTSQIDSHPNKGGHSNVATETWYKLEIEQKKNHKGEVIYNI